MGCINKVFKAEIDLDLFLLAQQAATASAASR